MNRTTWVFIYSLLLTFLLPALFPHIRLTYFAPFLIVAFYTHTKLTCVWLACGCGLLIDLLSSHTRLGIYALIYCVTTWLLYPYKRHFFEERLSTLPIMTSLFACLSTLLEFFLLNLLGEGIQPSWESIKMDLLWMPLQDALFAGLAFTLPLLLFPKPSTRRPSMLFGHKRRSVN